MSVVVLLPLTLVLPLSLPANSRPLPGPVTSLTLTVRSVGAVAGSGASITMFGTYTGAPTAPPGVAGAAARGATPAAVGDTNAMVLPELTFGMSPVRLPVRL